MHLVPWRYTYDLVGCCKSNLAELRWICFAIKEQPVETDKLEQTFETVELEQAVEAVELEEPVETDELEQPVETAQF